MRNVDLRVTSDVTLHVTHLRGRFVPAGDSEIPHLDDRDSYLVSIGSGEIGNYIYWRGAKLRFGKLTMTDTDLELVDADPSDPFDFSVDHWNDQLVAGYSKNTTGGGLKTHIPDYNDLRPKK